MTREEAYIWNENSHDENYSTVQEMEESIHYLLKRIYDRFDIQIKELKEDYSKRNCSNCKFVGYFSPHESLECQNNDCNFYGNDVDIFTSCNKWEAK